MANNQQLISIVIPVFNESLNLDKLFKTLNIATNDLPYKVEYIAVDDGSTDDSLSKLEALAKKHKNLNVIALARNFGKEIALTAGLHHAKGQAAIMIDSDLQHPPYYIARFIKKWQNGADVVVGVRTKSGKNNIVQAAASKVFYSIIGKMSQTPITPQATDFRLIDRQVIDEFIRFTERSRMVRGLIDWLGFDREFVYFEADKRHAGKPGYTTRKLIGFAVNSFISMSQTPLRFAGYLGAVIVIISGPLGAYMLIDKYFYDNKFDFSGPAALAVLILFLIGITLINIGIMSVYIANIHGEVSNRPLYVVRKKRAKRK